MTRATLDQRIKKGYQFTGLSLRAGDIARAEAIANLLLETDLHLTPDELKSIRSFSRKLYRDTSTYQGIVDRMTSNVVGRNGIVLKSRAGNQKLNNRIEDEFSEYLDTCEVRGLDDSISLMEKVLIDYIVDGDVGAILLDDGNIQLVEAPAINKGKMEKGVPGIDLNRKRKPIRFYVNGTPYGPENFVYITHRGLSDQTRGLPIFCSALPNILRIEDVLNAEVQSWRNNARIAFIAKHSASNKIPLVGKEDEQQPNDGTVRRQEELSEGLIYHTKTDEDLVPYNYQRASGSFEASIYLYLRMAGISAGIPVEFLMLDWSKWNYSANRSQFEQFYPSILKIHRKISKGFFSPIFRRWMQRKIEEKKYSDKPNMYSHEWLNPPFPFIDEGKELDAWAAKIDRGLATQGQTATMLNVDIEDVMKDRQKELSNAWKRAVEFETETGGRVSAQEIFPYFAGLNMGKTQAAAISKNAATATPPQTVAQPEGISQ